MGVDAHNSVRDTYSLTVPGALIAEFEDEDFDNLTAEEFEAFIQSGQALLQKHDGADVAGEGQPVLYSTADEIKVRAVLPSLQAPGVGSTMAGAGVCSRQSPCHHRSRRLVNLSRGTPGYRESRDVSLCITLL